MLTAAEVKKAARALGADAVGIASMDRYEGAPLQMDPRQIMPEAKSMIAMAFRVFRGSLRGIEEGTFFSNYSSMGYGGLTYLYMPLTVINLCKVIEDAGYEAIPIGHQSDWRAIGESGQPSRGSRPVRPGQAQPDIMVHLRIAGFLSGLGEIGYSKVFLTPEFGPRQRLGVVLTEAELEPDPIYDGPPLCNRCMACVKECPGNAIPADKTVKVELAGRTIEWADLDLDACGNAFRGGEEAGPDEAGGYMPPRLGVEKFTPSFISPFYAKPRNLYNTGQAICGGRGCLRACMISLGKRGVLKNKFKAEFRRRKPWTVDWSQPMDGRPAWADAPHDEA